jgi:hypothetical protein
MGYSNAVRINTRHPDAYFKNNIYQIAPAADLDGLHGGKSQKFY